MKSQKGNNQKDEAIATEMEEFKPKGDQEKKSEIPKETIDFPQQKSVSVFRLYTNLSSMTEIILMVIGIITCMASGCFNPIMVYLAGHTTSEFSGASSSNIGDLSYEEKVLFMINFEVIVMDLVMQFVYVSVAGFVVQFAMYSIWAYLGLIQIHHLKEKYFSIILAQEQGWFDRSNSFEFATKVQAQIQQIELGVGERFGQSLELVCQAIAGISIAFWSSWKLTLITLIFSPFSIALTFYLLHSMKAFMVAGRKTYEAAGGIAEEVLYNIKTVASFSNFDFEFDRYNEAIEKVKQFDIKKTLRMGVITGGLVFCAYAAFCVAVVFIREMIANKEWNSNTNAPLKGGDIMTVNFNTNICVMAIGMIAPNIKLIQEACIAARDYFELVDRLPSIKLSDSAMKPDRSSIQGKIEFKNVSFSYDKDKEKKVLNELSVTLTPGKKIAFVGESGCGKSTLVNLIERLYDIDLGEILFDGIDIYKYDLFYLRTLIGYVQQEPVLFNKSIRDNIIFGREAVVKELGDMDSLIEQACSDAHALEFINRNPEKMDYVVGVKGSKLSGGQKQRIAIARALLCQPKVVVLDEATSALDNVSEKEVQKTIDELNQKNVTTIIIAHRLSTIINADSINVMKDGKIIEQGTHEELLKLNGFYAKLFNSQLKEKKDSPKEEKTVQTETSIETNKEGEAKKEETEEDSSEDLSKTKVSIRRVLSLLKNNKMDFLLGVLSSMGKGVICPIDGWISSLLINAICNGDIEVVRNDGLKYALIYLAIALLVNFFLALKMWKVEAIGSVLTAELRKKVFNKYLNLHMSYFDKESNSPGALITKLSIDTTQLNTLVLLIFGNLLTAFTTIVVGFGFGFAFDWRLTLISLAFIVANVVLNALVGYTKQNGRQSFQKINIESGGFLSECVVNNKTIFSFNFQKPAIQMYMAILDEAKVNFIRDSVLNGFLTSIAYQTYFLLKAAIYYVSFLYIKNGSLIFEDMTIVLQVLIMTSYGIQDGISGMGNFRKAAIAFRSLFSTIDLESSIDISKEGNQNKISPANLKGKIEFRNVSFSYPTKKSISILNNINFTIQPGQSVALVGSSGNGKSTIIQLLERFYDVQEGEILIDDVNIKDYNLLELRKKIGLVAQEPVLFKRSVYDNILYGKLTATKDEVFSSAQKAAIEKLYNQREIDDKENPVSGGEKQRLAIARTFLKDPSILLFDEATSALDKQSEVEVQKSIYELQQKKTSITVSHRMNTIVNSDMILFIEKGQVAEQGTHEELMSQNGKYCNLYQYSNTN